MDIKLSKIYNGMSMKVATKSLFLEVWVLFSDSS